MPAAGDLALSRGLDERRARSILPGEAVIVETWMTRDLVTVGPDTPVAEAQRLMASGAFRRLPVIEADRLCGIVVRSDLTRPPRPDWSQAAGAAQAPTVRQIMTGRVEATSPMTPLADAVAVMIQKKIDALPVVLSSGTLVGILTVSDAMRALVGTIGLGQAGARITFAGANPDTIIRFVVGKAERLHLKIQNVQVAEVGSEHHVTVGVSGRRAVDLVDAAWAAGHKVRGVVDSGSAA